MSRTPGVLRVKGSHHFLRHEAAGMVLACALIASFPFVTFPVGFFAVAIVAVLIVRRAWLAR